MRKLGFALLAALAVSRCAADVEDRAWVFTQAGNSLGWTGSGYFLTKGVDAGYWWGQTNGTPSYLLSADYLGIPAQANHYVSIRMRIRLTSGPTDRFGPTDAYVWWGTNTSPSQSDQRRIAIKSYGNGAWKTYNVRVGNHALWTGTIRRLRIDPMTKSGARVEVAWIKVVRETDPPEFRAEHRWTYSDGQTTNDHTPTLSLLDCYDVVSGLDRAEFYYRPGNSTSESDWVFHGTDADWDDGGYQHTYSSLADGTWDLGVKVYDRAGNAAYWIHDDDNWIDDLRIDSNLTTRITVDASAVLGPVPKRIFGNNILWYQWSNKYNASTGRLTDNIENLIAGMGITSFRYASGDTFWWKLAIGPVAQRASQYDRDTSMMKGPAVFGIDECLRWCEQRDIEPLFTIRFRWPGGPPAPLYDEADPYPQALSDAADLVEYCNSPNDGSNPNGGTDWAAVRAQNGRPDPYNVKMFEIGNEPWGFDPYGSPGNYGFDGPTEYSLAFLKYLEAMTAVDPTIRVSLTSQTPCQLDFDPVDPGWARSVYEQTGAYVDYVQFHPYLPYSAWQTDLIKLYDETMATPKALDEVLSGHKCTFRLAAPEKADSFRIRLTEWNINYNWIYDPSQGRINTYHSKTLKAAIATADALRVFMENGNLVESAQYWSLYKNGPWGCHDDSTKYPVYHVFRIYNRHFGDDLVGTTVVGSPTFDYIKDAGNILRSQYDIPYLTASAAKSADGSALYLIVTNKDRSNAHSASVDLASFLSTPSGYAAAEIWELNGPNVDDYNNPSSVTIAESSANLGTSFTYAFPAHSVTSFKFVESPRTVSTPGPAKSFEDGTLVRIENKVVSAVFPPDALYVQDADRSSGIRVAAEELTASEGNLATVVGRIRTNADGERYIEADSISHDESSVVVLPVSMTPRSVGGGTQGLQKAVQNWVFGEIPGSDPPVYDLFPNPSVELSNVGLLVSAWGKVTQKGAGYLYIDDGTLLKDGTSTGAEENVGVRVVCDPSAYQAGDMLIVTGISSCFETPSGSTARGILTRRPSDIRKLWPQ